MTPPPTAVRLGLGPHPEGGWYRRTWTSPAVVAGGRPAASAVLFLLDVGECSAWHRVDGDELWLWHGPGTLVLESADEPAGRAEQQVLGPGAVQVLVPAGRWQRTLPAGHEVLVSCVISPGFEWSGFQLG